MAGEHSTEDFQTVFKKLQGERNRRRRDIRSQIKELQTAQKNIKIRVRRLQDELSQIDINEALENFDFSPRHESPVRPLLKNSRRASHRPETRTCQSSPPDYFSTSKRRNHRAKADLHSKKPSPPSTSAPVEVPTDIDPSIRLQCHLAYSRLAKLQLRLQRINYARNGLCI